MIYTLLEYARQTLDVKVPLVFSYYSTRMILAAVTSLFITVFLGPWFIRKLTELSRGQATRTEDCPSLAELHKGKRDTPTMGGILILTSILASMILWMDLGSIFTLILFATTIALGLLGIVDDYRKLRDKSSKGVSGRKKLMVQVAVGGLLALYLLVPSVTEWVHSGSLFAPPVIREWVGGSQTLSLQEFASRIYFPFYKGYLFELSGALTILAALFIVFVVTGSSNAVNLTDGLDGLATGCLILVASTLALIAFVSNHAVLARYLNILYIEGSGEIAIFLSAFVGAAIGFLWYNGYPAQLFMGDTGSLALGGIIGVSAVLLSREFLLGIIGGIFVAEALSVILQVGSYRYRNKKRIFLCAPLHHHFEYKGWPETKVVLRFWIVGLLLAIIGIASLKFQ